MTVAPSSEITLATDGGDGSMTTIFQKIGSVLYTVEKQSDQHFEVETPFLAAVVKGTSFTVGVNNSAAVTHVVEGAVEVTSFGNQQSQMVRPGQTVTVSNANGLQLEMSHNRGRGASCGGRRPNRRRGPRTRTATRAASASSIARSA